MVFSGGSLVWKFQIMFTELDACEKDQIRIRTIANSVSFQQVTEWVSGNVIQCVMCDKMCSVMCNTSNPKFVAFKDSFVLDLNASFGFAEWQYF